MSSDQGNGNIAVEDDCPLCLEPLPPFWDVTGLTQSYCCAQHICLDCDGKRRAHLQRAYDEGSFGRQEEQLGTTCPLCRAKIPGDGAMGLFMLENYDRGQLPLSLHYKLGMGFLKGWEGLEKDVEKGLEILMVGAEGGDPTCQFAVGSEYREGGNGLAQSTTEAKRWYLASTAQGHALAEHSLALMMIEEGDEAEALRHLRGAALKGFDDACYMLGIMHYQGMHGAQKSKKEAIRFLTLAAERGYEKSVQVLGRIMCSPEVPPPVNPYWVKGMHWLQRAAATKDAGSIAELEKIEEWVSGGCFGCGMKAPPGIATLRCSRCRAVWYCTKDCQRRHWKAKEGGHKQFCIKWE